jgi:hypothetical protein
MPRAIVAGGPILEALIDVAIGAIGIDHLVATEGAENPVAIATRSGTVILLHLLLALQLGVRGVCPHTFHKIRNDFRDRCCHLGSSHESKKSENDKGGDRLVTFTLGRSVGEG